MTYCFDAAAKLIAVQVPVTGALLQARTDGRLQVWDACRWREVTSAEREAWGKAADDALRAAPGVRVMLPIVWG